VGLSRRKLAFAGVAAIPIAVLVAVYAAPLPTDYFPRGSTVVELRDGSTAFVFLSPDDKWRIHRELSEIDRRYIDALLRVEDHRFYDHAGVDPIAIVRATFQNLSHFRIVSGASTLTMQLVRMREPRSRTLFSKAVECFRAFQIEARYEKDQILALYLTHVPYGKNVEGIEAASLAYFGHRADALSPEEIATLLAVPQNPNARFPHPQHSDRLRAARDAIASRLAFAPIAAAPPERLKVFPRLAPHAARWLRAKQPQAERIRTNLDRAAQLLAEKTLAGEATHLRSLGIHNASAVVIDHRTGEVRALVGNLDFWDADHGGQIAGFDRARSPGSALKPFIYALAIDRGLALPEHLVLDVPIEYGTYSPDNYDGRWNGLVTLEDALSRSLNVPFVNLLAQIGVDRFVGSLVAWGADSLIDRPGYYGLSAAIGGLELTPLELGGMYAALANGGGYRTPAILPRAEEPSIEAFSRSAAHLTRRALRIRDRPDFPSRRRFARMPKNIHWKTGTSYGHRDAWAAGSTGAFTAVIWTGNFDNTPSVHLVGADAAGPILFDLLEALGDGGEEGPPPRDLVGVEVCAFSGRLSGPGCGHTKIILAPKKHVPTERCPYHVAIDVERKTGLALAPNCRAGHDYDRRTFVSFPPSLARHLAPELKSLPGPPDLAPGCAKVATARPKIVSPGPNKMLMLMPGLDATDQEVPLIAEGSGTRASWFVDGSFLGTVAMHERLWWTPSAGEHEFVVTDETGASASARVRVDHQN
jgi:penicillin-binding protein 1C